MNNQCPDNRAVSEIGLELYLQTAWTNHPARPIPETYRLKESKVITGVAIRNENLIITLPKPARHCDCFKYLSDNFGKETARQLRIGIRGKDQGFVTDKGVYLDRCQAMRHVKRCGQKLIESEGPHKWSHPLFSEDLW